MVFLEFPTHWQTNFPRETGFRYTSPIWFEPNTGPFQAPQAGPGSPNSGVGVPFRLNRALVNLFSPPLGVCRAPRLSQSWVDLVCGLNRPGMKGYSPGFGPTGPQRPSEPDPPLIALPGWDPGPSRSTPSSAVWALFVCTTSTNAGSWPNK